MFDKIKAFAGSFNQKIKDFIALLKADSVAAWNQNKALFIALGAIVLTIKFRQILIDIIVSGSKALMAKTQKKSDADQTKENQANAQADALVKDAQELPTKQEPVGDDWNKK